MLMVSTVPPVSGMTRQRLMVAHDALAESQHAQQVASVMRESCLQVLESTYHFTTGGKYKS